MDMEHIRRSLELGILPELAYRIRFSEKDAERIETISAFLEERTDYSFIIYFNHISYNDPLLAAHLLEKIDKNHSRYLIAPASYSHTEPGNKFSKFFMKMTNEAQRCGIEIIRVIQTYQVDNPEYGYTIEQAQRTYKNWMRRLKDLHGEGRSVGVIISPEGHRSEGGVLGEAEKGMVASGRLVAPVLFIPVGIFYEGEYQRSKFNIGKTVRLSIGEVFAQESVKEGPELNLLMHNLAMTLPEEMRGCW